MNRQREHAEGPPPPALLADRQGQRAWPVRNTEGGTQPALGREVGSSEVRWQRGVRDQEARRREPRRSRAVVLNSEGRGGW